MKKLIAKILIVTTLVLTPFATTLVQQEDQVASIAQKETEFNTSAKDPGGNGG